MSICDLSTIKERSFSICQAEKSIFLPNTDPASYAIDYIFITMEPSLMWSRELSSECCDPIAMGFKNFMFSLEDFILHYCIRNFLCKNPNKKGSTYYITDLSKGAMPTKDADKDRNLRYARWFSLLIAELNLVSYRRTQFVAVGKTVYDFLVNSCFANYFSLTKAQISLFRILHYSRIASRFRVRCNNTSDCSRNTPKPEENGCMQDNEESIEKIQDGEECIKAGVCSVNITDIIRTAWDVLICAGVKKNLALKIVSRINKPLTKNDLNLICTYYTQLVHGDINGNKII